MLLLEFIGQNIFSCLSGQSMRNLMLMHSFSVKFFPEALLIIKSCIAANTAFRFLPYLFHAYKVKCRTNRVLLLF